MDATDAISPFTQRNAQYLRHQSPIGGLNLFGWAHPDIDVDTLWVAESLAVWWRGGEVPSAEWNEPPILRQDIEAVSSLVLSQLWRSKRGLAKRLVLCRSDAEIGKLVDWAGDPRSLRGFEFRGFDSIRRECDTLSFEERALRTLENIHHEARRLNKPVEVGLLGIGRENEALFRLRERYLESGMTYATVPIDAPAIYEWLMHKNLLALRHNPPETGLVVAPDGHEVLDLRRRRGLDAKGVGVFVVQRYDEDLDKFLRPVLDVLKGRLGVAIGAVWADDHIDKIDERIFRRIRDCQAVLLHVTNDRFNVGLEAGYALALGKPVVAFREKPKDTDPDWIKRLPFDISTLNCLEYDPNADTTELIARLEARLSLAIGA